MAIARRLRFEILRRDNHSCRYCGAMAPDVALTVDHVVPVALGGSDEPSNLVTACQPCNAGKSSIPVGSEIVEQVAKDALRWSRAMAEAAQAAAMDRLAIEDSLGVFRDRWDDWTYPDIEVVEPEPLDKTGDQLLDSWRSIVGWVGASSRPVSFEDGVLKVQVKRGWTSEVRKAIRGHSKQFSVLLGESISRIDITNDFDGPLPAEPKATQREVRRSLPLPGDWEASVERFLAAGLTLDDLERLIKIAMLRRGVPADEAFRFFCGCCWRTLTDLQESARRIIESEGADGS